MNIIEWSQMSWNPVAGCTPISMGCAHCYALTRAQKLQYSGVKKYEDGFKLKVHPNLLNPDFNKYPPSRIFAGSMTDLFHDNIPLEIKRQVFIVIHNNPKHLFLVVTKRAERVHEQRNHFSAIPNLILAVTVEHADYKHRIRLLQETNAIHKAVFFEPLLGDIGDVDLTGIQWAFVGGESGPGFREMDKSWVISLKDQCDRQNCTFIFKQWHGNPRGVNGCRLDGQIYNQIPTIDVITGNNI